MKIEVGEYIKNRTGDIAKVLAFKENDYIDTDNDRFGMLINGEEVSFCPISEIIEHSKNIIDLIEVGDIVMIDRGKLGHSTHIIETKFGLNMLKEDLKKFKDEHIKSIVTKEQLADIEYKVEE